MSSVLGTTKASVSVHTIRNLHNINGKFARFAPESTSAVVEPPDAVATSQATGAITR